MGNGFYVRSIWLDVWRLGVFFILLDGSDMYETLQRKGNISCKVYTRSYQRQCIRCSAATPSLFTAREDCHFRGSQLSRCSVQCGSLLLLICRFPFQRFCLAALCARFYRYKSSAFGPLFVVDLRAMSRLWGREGASHFKKVYPFNRVGAMSLGTLFWKATLMKKTECFKNNFSYKMSTQSAA